MNKYKNHIITAAVIITILIVSFVFGGNIPKSSAPQTSPAANTEQPLSEISLSTPQAPEATPKSGASPAPTEFAAQSTPAPTEFAAQSTPVPTEIIKESTPQPSTEPSAPPSTAPDFKTEKDLTCTISITCNTVLSNMSYLTSGKQSIIPPDGVILAEKTAVFFEGESVFNVLARETRQNGIHLEFVNVPFYNSAYIEGIANLYEFDCGELSGWMYKVNGDFPRFGSSQYTVKQGDKIEWVYTCNQGADVGDNSGTTNGFSKEN